MEIPILLGFLLYNACLLLAITLLGTAGFKAWKTYRKSRTLPSKPIFIAVCFALMLFAMQACVNYKEQNSGAEQQRRDAEASGIQIYVPKTSMGRDSILSVNMAEGFTVTYTGRSLYKLTEVRAADYPASAGDSDCYITSEALEYRNKQLQDITVTGNSNGTLKEAPTNPNYKPVQNDCERLGRTNQGFEVFVEASAYNGNGGASYKVLAKIGQTVAMLDLNRKVEPGTIVAYFDHLTLTPTKDVVFIDKTNRLLIANHF